MPELAVAPQLDDDVAVEPLAEVDREVAPPGDRLGILAVDVEDRDLQHAGDVGGVGASTWRRCGEVVKPIWLLTTTWMVPPTRVAVELRHVERLGDDALPGEGGVAVDEDAAAPRVRAAVAQAVLLGAHAPLHHGVHPLEVAGVEGQREVHLVPVGVVADPIARVAEVVLHVAAAVVGRPWSSLVQELGEDLRGRLAEHVGQHVEPPAVGHADDDLR